MKGEDQVCVRSRRAFQAVNTALLDLYWQIGENISRRIAAAEWVPLWWFAWQRTLLVRIPACEASRGPTNFAFGSSTRRTPARARSLSTAETNSLDARAPQSPKAPKANLRVHVERTTMSR